MLYDIDPGLAGRRATASGVPPETRARGRYALPGLRFGRLLEAEGRAGEC